MVAGGTIETFGVIGCGLIGARRATAAAAQGLSLLGAADLDADRAASLFGASRRLAPGARAIGDWREVVAARPEVLHARALIAQDRQLALAPSRLQEFMQRLRQAFDTATEAGEAPVLLTSGGIRFHVRAIVERIRPTTPVLAQAEIFPRVRIRTVGTI